MNDSTIIDTTRCDEVTAKPPSQLFTVRIWPELSDTPIDFAYIPSAMGHGPSLGLGLPQSRRARAAGGCRQREA